MLLPDKKGMWLYETKLSTAIVPVRSCPFASYNILDLSYHRRFKSYYLYFHQKCQICNVNKNFVVMKVLYYFSSLWKLLNNLIQKQNSGHNNLHVTCTSSMHTVINLRSNVENNWNAGISCCKYYIQLRTWKKTCNGIRKKPVHHQLVKHTYNLVLIKSKYR